MKQIHYPRGCGSKSSLAAAWACAILLGLNYHCRAAEKEQAAPLPPRSLTALETQNKEIDIAGSLGGIGAKLAKGEGFILVTNVFQGSPAERAGLRSGTRILAIQQKPTSTMSLEESIQLLRGAPGTAVSLEVAEPRGFARKLTLVREKIVTSAFESRVLEGGILLMKPGGFNRETAAMFESKLGKNLPPATRGIILDLRDSPGGLAEVILRVTGMFIPQGKPVWYTKGFIGEVQEIKSPGTPITDLPVAILVNENTTGAELMASALQSNRRGVVLGQPSSGKVTTVGVSEMVKKPDGTSTMVRRGVFLFDREGSKPRVIPDVPLPASTTESDLVKAAQKAMNL